MSKNIVESIIDFGEYPKLQKTGENKGENVEIFTPQFIVDDMISLIGNSYVEDIAHTVLEPASGDGVFIIHILDLRLNSIWGKDKIHYQQKSLQAVSTIFSLEMNELLITKQRSNIYTMLCQFARDNQINLSDSYHKLLKEIIATNFIWAETNIKSKIVPNLFGLEVAWYMPESNKKENNIVKFARWAINEDLSYSMILEDGEIG